MNLSEAFDKSLRKFKITAKWLSEKSGVSEKMISLFRNSRQRIYTDSLEKLINALPSEARLYFFSLLSGENSIIEDNESLSGKDKDWHSIFSDATPADLEEIFLAMAKRWSQMKSKKKDKKDKKAEIEDLARSA